MNRPLLLTILALCLFYALAGWKAVHPQVGKAYYSYFIDKSSGLSPVEQARLRPVTIGRTYSHQDVTIGYAWWSAPEPEHRWSDGNKAEIVFVLQDARPPNAPQTLAIKHHTAGRQRVEWQLNQGPKQRAVLEGKTEWKLPLAGRDLSTGTNVLFFSFPDAQRPGTDDLRRLALALESVRFE